MACILCFDSPLHHGPCMELSRKDYNRCKWDETFFDKKFQEFVKEQEESEPCCFSAAKQRKVIYHGRAR